MLGLASTLFASGLVTSPSPRVIMKFGGSSVRDAERKVDQDVAQSNATHRQLDDAEAAMQAAVAHKDDAAIRAARAQLVRPPPTTPVPCKQTPS